MKKVIILSITLLIFGSSIFFHDEITNYFTDIINNKSKNASTLKNNSYANKYNFEFVKLTDNFTVEKEEDFKNIYYTVLNSGMEKFTFYCSKKYENCINDIDYFSNDKKLLSYIDNFVPVYNTFKNIETEFDTLGKITINIEYNYTKDEIDKIEEVINKVINENINSNMSTKDKIKVIHDYIINNSKYDPYKREDINNETKYKSNKAYGNLIEGYGICGGYTDSMKLFLDKLNIPNYKVANEHHIWNAVYIDNEWLHLDLTWDDPIKGEEDLLEYNYFLITTNKLHDIEKEQHNFDTNIYKELGKQS